MLNTIKEKGLFRCVIYIFINPLYKIVAKNMNKYLQKHEVKENYIIYKSHPDYSDNSKALYEYMIKKNPKIKNIWFLDKETKKKKIQKIINDKNTILIHDTSKFHKGLSLKALYYLNKSKYIYYTQGSIISSFKPKEGQLRINLWHGCGYKNAPQSKDGKKWIDNNYFDYVIVPGKIFIETKSEFFGCEKSKILDLGYPRYDLLQENNEKTAEYVKRISNNNRLILWMPTFRTTNNTKANKGYFPEEKSYIDFDLPILNSIKEVEKLNNLCKKKKISLYIKRHPNQKKYSFENILFSNLIFIDNETLVKNNIDLYSLLKYTDGLITDYSSVAIDYLLLNKPIAFTLDDFEKYSKTRGFVFKNPKKYMPGHHIYNFNDMQKFIEDIGNNIDNYKSDRQAIMNEVHNPCENYCERIVNKVNELMEVKNEKDIEENYKKN